MVFIRRFVLMIRKDFESDFSPKKRHKMMASRQVQIPFFKVVGRQRQRVWWFGDLSKTLGETNFPFCVKISSQVQNPKVLTCWNLLRQKLQRLLVVERISRELQRVWANRLWKDSWVLVAGKELQKSHSHRVKSCKTNQSVAKRRFYKHFSLVMSGGFWYQTSVAVSGIIGGKVPLIDNIFSSC